jgi:hypothetical protein
MTDAAVGSGSETKEIVCRLGGCDSTEIRNAGVDHWRQRANVGSERDYVSVRQIEHDPDWPCLTLVRAVRRKRAVEIAGPRRDVTTAVPTDTGASRKAELN